MRARAMETFFSSVATAPSSVVFFSSSIVLSLFLIGLVNSLVEASRLKTRFSPGTPGRRTDAAASRVDSGPTGFQRAKHPPREKYNANGFRMTGRVKNCSSVSTCEVEMFQPNGTLKSLAQIFFPRKPPRKLSFKIRTAPSQTLDFIEFRNSPGLLRRNLHVPDLAAIQRMCNCFPSGRID